jgi:hypothetical protein
MKKHSPTCPRCGYDLSGQVAAAEAGDADSFPMQGLCSECGLTFAWGDVFGASRLKVRGFVEHSRLWVTAVTAWRTWAWTILPFVFWGKVRLEHRPRLGRVALWSFIVLIAPWVLAGIPYAVGGWPRTIAAARAVPSGYLLEVLIAPWRNPYSSPIQATADSVMDFVGDYPIFFCVGVVMSIMFPLVLVGLPDTRARAKIRLSHVARAAVYQLAWLVPVMMFQAAKVLSVGMWLHISLWQRTKATLIPGPTPGTMMYSAAPLSPWQTAVFGIPRDIEGLARDHWLPWLAILLPWWLWWWWAALKRGYRLEQAWRVYGVVLIPTLLAAAIILVVHPYFLRSVL